jgi:hypothetical protein
VQNVSAPEGPMSRPRISRRPSLLTPTAMMWRPRQCGHSGAPSDRVASIHR